MWRIWSSIKCQIYIWVLFHIIELQHLRQLRSRAMATHSSTLAWRIPWTEEPGGLPSMGSHRVGHDWCDLATAAAAAAATGHWSIISHGFSIVVFFFSFKQIFFFFFCFLLNGPTCFPILYLGAFLKSSLFDGEMNQISRRKVPSLSPNLATCSHVTLSKSLISLSFRFLIYKIRAIKSTLYRGVLWRSKLD